MAHKTTVQSPSRRPWKAGIVFAVTLFLLGGSVGFVQAATDSQQAALNLEEDGFVLPLATVGEVAVYDLTLTGDWESLPENQSYLGDYAVFEAIGEEPLRYPDGHVQNAVAMTEDRWLLSWTYDEKEDTRLAEPYLDWHWMERAFLADPETNQPVASVGSGNGTVSESDDVVTVQGSAEASVISYWISEDAKDCLYAVPPAIEAGASDEWSWTGCTIDSFSLWLEDDDGAEIVEPAGADGRLHLRMQDHEWNLTVDLWYHPEVSRLVEMQVVFDEPQKFLHATVRLTHYNSSDGLAVDPTWLEPPLAPIRQLPWTDPWPDDSDLDHPFPLSEAMQRALDDPIYQDLNEFLDDNPDAYVDGFSYSRFEDDKEISRRWYIDVRGSGDSAMSMWVTMKTPAPASSDEVVDPAVLDQAARYEFDTWPFDIEPRSPPAENRPETFHSFGDMVHWLDVFSGDLGTSDHEPGFWWNTYCIGEYGCFDFMWISRENFQHSSVPVQPPETPVPQEFGTTQFRDATLILHDWVPRAVFTYSVDYQWGLTAVDGQPPERPDETPAVKEETEVGTFATVWSAPSPAATGVSLGIALLTGLLYYVWPSLKQFFGFGLFSRLQTPTLFQHPARRAIHDVIRAEPGIRFAALGDQTGLANGTLRHHLNMLCDADLITRKEAGGFTCYFVPDDATAENTAKASAVQSDGARTVLDFIDGHPGTTARRIADATDLAVGTVGYHVKRLRDAGLVLSERDGRQVRLSLA